MHNADQLAEIEKSMREEHRKDLEAFERLKRFLPSNRGTSKSAEKANGVGNPMNTEDFQLELENGLAPSSIIGRVEAIMIADTERKWTVPLMLDQLKKDKFPLVAKKPISTLGLVFAKLRKRGKIKLVRHGAGRNPNIFKGVLPQPLEGDSDISHKSDRATQGQPDHVH